MSIKAKQEQFSHVVLFDAEEYLFGLGRNRVVLEGIG
jgi:hypothetical protein